MRKYLEWYPIPTPLYSELCVCVCGGGNTYPKILQTITKAPQHLLKPPNSARQVPTKSPNSLREVTEKSQRSPQQVYDKYPQSPTP